MSFNLPQQGNTTRSRAVQGRSGFTPARIAWIVVGAICIVVSVVMFAAHVGEAPSNLGSGGSMSSQDLGQETLALLPFALRILLIVFGVFALIKGLTGRSVNPFRRRR